MEYTDFGFSHRFVSGTERGPTILLLNGTGGEEAELLSFGREIWPGAALLNLRGNVFEDGVPRFFKRMAGGAFDVDELKLRTDELSAFLDGASQRYHFRENRSMAIGYSDGADIAASLMLLHPHHLAAAVLFRPIVPF